MLYVFEASLGRGGSLEHARSAALALLVCASLSATATLTGMRTRVARVVALATLGLAATLLQLPAAARILGLEPLALWEWGVTAALAVIGCVPLALSAARGSVRARPLRPSA